MLELDASVLMSSASSSDLAAPPSSGAYGMKTLRSLRNAKPSGRLQKKMDVTYNYFLEEVDPIIGDCITYLLCAQPRDVPLAMLEYLQAKADALKATAGAGSSSGAGAAPVPGSGEDIPASDEGTDTDTANNSSSSSKGSRPKREQKLYLAMSIGPVVAKLVNRVAISRPKRVVDFLCHELRLMIFGSGAAVTAAGEGEEGPRFDELDDRFIEYGTFVPIQQPEMLPPTQLAVPDVSLYNSSVPESGASDDAATSAETAAPTTTQQQQAGVAPSPAPISIITSSSTTSISQPVIATTTATAAPAAATEPSVRKLQLALLGMDLAGKSSILNAIQGKSDSKTKPTIGFRPVELMLDESTRVRFYDLGGGARIRDIWNQYYHDVHAVVYVIDASESDEKRWNEAVELFKATLSSSYLSGKPLLVLCNKQDVPGARSAEACATALNITPTDDGHTSISIIPCSALYSSSDDDEQQSLDTRIENSLEGILNTIQSNFITLNTRVEKDTQQKAKDDARKRLERERKVLRSKIAAAFPDEVSPQYKPELPASVEDSFTQEEGITFISAELGVDSTDLPQIACDIAALVGYQRLALQIIGALKAPISTKKVALDWDEIRALVGELRVELGLADAVV